MARQTLFNFYSSDDPTRLQECYSTDNVISNNGNDNVYWNDTRYNINIRNSAIYVRDVQSGGYTTTYIYIIAFGSNSFTIDYGGGSALFTVNHGNYYSRDLQYNENMYSCHVIGVYAVRKYDFCNNTIPIFYDYNEFYNYTTNTYIEWENANTTLYKLGTKTYGLQNEWLSKLNEENPFSGITITHSNLFTYMVDTGDIIDIDWSKGIQTIEMKYGKIVMGSDGYGRVHVYDNNNGIIVQITGILTWLTTRNLYFIACVNHKHQVGRIGLIVDPGSYGTSLYISSPSKNREAYEFITQNVLGAKVKVSYYLPDDTYTYSKLTYNSEHEPEDKDDGTSIDILPSNTSVNVEGLEEDTLYYFTIFTNKSESEPFPFTATPDPVPPEYKSFINNINGIGFDWIKELEQDTATITNSDHSTFTSNMYKYYPMNKVTWYTYHHQGTDVENWNKTTFGELTTALFVSSKIDKVEINSNNGVYSCTITKNNQNTERDPNRMFVYDKTITMGGVYTDATLPRSWYANFYGHSNYLACTNCNPFYLAGSWSTRTFSGTLTEVFTQLQRYVRNIDIYVDGELWSKAGK